MGENAVAPPLPMTDLPSPCSYGVDISFKSRTGITYDKLKVPRKVALPTVASSSSRSCCSEIQLCQNQASHEEQSTWCHVLP